jgi:hypothetical protein
MMRVTVPVFLSVTTCGELVVPTVWLGNVSRLDDKVTVGATPVPVRPSVMGLLAPVSEIVTAAVRAPLRDGVNVTEIVQLACFASELGQLLVWEKSDGSLPVMLIETLAATGLKF